MREKIDVKGIPALQKKSTKDQMQLLDMNETIDQLARAIGVRWYGHALRKDMNNFLISAFDNKWKWTRKIGRPKLTRLKAVAVQDRNVGLSASDAIDRSSLKLGVNAIFNMMR